MEHIVKVTDIDGFTYFVNIYQIADVQLAPDFDECRIFMAGLIIILRTEEYNKTLKKFFEPRSSRIRVVTEG